jgi:hypothetical protein
MDSSDSNEELELIAALVDGKLSGEERTRAVKLLANSDEALELYASTLRYQQESSDVKVVPISSARRWRRWTVIAPAAAAAVLAIVVVPRLVSRSGPAVSASAYATELIGNPRFDGGLHAGWEQRGWSVTRGGAGSRETSGTQQVRTPLESKLAFRLGVRSVDLQVALLRPDTALAGRLTDEIIDNLKGIAFSDLAGAGYTDLRSRLATDTRAQAIDRASGAEREVRDLLKNTPFEFGEWAGAADLAAQTHDASFFESKHGASAVKSIVPAGSLDPEDVEALGTIDARVKQGLTDSALDEVHAVLQSIIRRRGG